MASPKTPKHKQGTAQEDAVLLRNDYDMLRDFSRKAGLALMALSIVCMVCMVCAILAIASKPQASYFAVTQNLQVIKLSRIPDPFTQSPATHSP